MVFESSTRSRLLWDWYSRNEDVYNILVDRLPRSPGTPVWYTDTAVGNSKSITVPAGKFYEISYVYGWLIASGSDGNRTLAARIWDGSQVVWISRAGGAITAGQTGSIMLSTDGRPLDTTLRRRQNNLNVNEDTSITDSMPFIRLPAGYRIDVADSANIHAAGDTLRFFVHAMEFDL